MSDLECMMLHLASIIDNQYRNKVTFRVRQYSRPIKPDQPIQDGLNPYWVYCSNDIDDYHEAIKYAIDEEKRTGIKNWVELQNYNPEYEW